MVRKAISSDVEWIEAMYNEHFAYENEHGAFTVFKKGIYPTKKDAEDALCAGALYVYEEEGSIAGSLSLIHILFDSDQIERLYFVGFQDGEGLAFLNQLNHLED